MSNRLLTYESCKTWIPEVLPAESPSSVTHHEMPPDPTTRYEEYYQQGYQAAQFELATQAKVAAETKLVGIIAEITAIRDEFAAVMKREAIDLCLNMVKHICRQLFSEDATFIQKMLHEAINLLPADDSPIKIYISEASYQQLMNSNTIAAMVKPNIHFLIDHTLNSGDFLIDTNTAAIDGILEHRLAMFKSQEG